HRRRQILEHVRFLHRIDESGVFVHVLPRHQAALESRSVAFSSVSFRKLSNFSATGTTLLIPEASAPTTIWPDGIWTRWIQQRLPSCSVSSSASLPPAAGAGLKPRSHDCPHHNSATPTTSTTAVAIPRRMNMLRVLGT